CCEAAEARGWGRRVSGASCPVHPSAPASCPLGPTLSPPPPRPSLFRFVAGGDGHLLTSVAGRIRGGVGTCRRVLGGNHSFRGGAMPMASNRGLVRCYTSAVALKINEFHAPFDHQAVRLQVLRRSHRPPSADQHDRRGR